MKSDWREKPFVAVCRKTILYFLWELADGRLVARMSNIQGSKLAQWLNIIQDLNVNGFAPWRVDENACRLRKPFSENGPPRKLSSYESTLGFMARVDRIAQNGHDE